MKYILQYSIIYFSIFILLTSCESPLDESDLYDYSIEQNMLCFCQQANSWTKLYIKSDTVATAYRISDNVELGYNEFRFFKSISGLFELITSTDTTEYHLRYTMDQTNSYPAYIFKNPKPIFINDSTIAIIDDADLAYITKNYDELD